MTVDHFDRISAEITEEEAAQEEFRAATEKTVTTPRNPLTSMPAKLTGAAGALGIVIYLLVGMKGDVAAHEPRIVATKDAVDKLEPRVGALEREASASSATQKSMLDGISRIENAMNAGFKELRERK